jgi:DNA excision repair protein ERCC-4
MATRQQGPVRIAVDDREARSPVLPALRELEDVAVSIRRLPVGDYRVDGSLLVERKTVPDLALSIRDGRLFRQAARLVQCSNARPCLIVEASADGHTRLAVPRHAVHGALITLSLVYGLPVLRSTSPAETARLIRIAARQLRRRQERGPLRWASKSGSDRRTRLLMLEAVPSIGPVRAAALLDAFGSIEAVSAATSEQLAVTSGIGIATARRLKHIVSGLDE